MTDASSPPPKRKSTAREIAEEFAGEIAAELVFQPAVLNLVAATAGKAVAGAADAAIIAGQAAAEAGSVVIDAAASVAEAVIDAA
jgi:hypothetical protein